jgi:hypothetical protein
VMERVTKVKMIFYSSERWEPRGGRVTKVKMIFFIAVKGESWTIRGEWLPVVVRIQCFDFDSRREAIGRSVTRR